MRQSLNLHSFLCFFFFVLDGLTFLCPLFKAVVDLLKHGLAAPLENRQHDALEGVFIGCLDGPLHRFGCCASNCVCRVLGKNYKKTKQKAATVRTRQCYEEDLCEKVWR